MSEKVNPYIEKVRNCQMGKDMDRTDGINIKKIAMVLKEAQNNGALNDFWEAVKYVGDDDGYNLEHMVRTTLTASANQ